MNRRTVLLSSLALFAPAGAALAASLPPVTAYRDPGCSCCGKPHQLYESYYDEDEPNP